MQAVSAMAAGALDPLSGASFALLQALTRVVLGAAAACTETVRVANGGSPSVAHPASVGNNLDEMMQTASAVNDSMHAAVRLFVITMGARAYDEGPLKKKERVEEKEGRRRRRERGRGERRRMSRRTRRTSREEEKGGPRVKPKKAN